LFECIIFHEGKMKNYSQTASAYQCIRERNFLNRIHLRCGGSLAFYVRVLRLDYHHLKGCENYVAHSCYSPVIYHLGIITFFRVIEDFHSFESFQRNPFFLKFFFRRKQFTKLSFMLCVCLVKIINKK
jgi:hypothetical protein